MRLPLIPPTKLTPQQKPLYDEMRKGIASNFNALQGRTRRWRVDGGTPGCMNRL
jgi:hypothetical protein